jgi:hypothetical protein
MADLLRALDVLVTGLMVFVWANLLWAGWATDWDARRRARARQR